MPWLQSNLARAYGDLGELDDARRCIDEAMTAMQTSNQRWCEAETNRIAGEITLLSAKRDVAGAEAYFEHALTVARQQQAKSWELRASMSLARARCSERVNCWLRCTGGSLRGLIRAI